MKFNKTLLAHEVPEWQNQYLNYKSLKKRVKAIHNEEQALLKASPKADVLNNPHIKSELAAFFFELDGNIEKVDDFYNTKFIEYERRLKRITSALPSSEGANPDATINALGLPTFDDEEEEEEIIGVLLELRNCFRNLKWYGELNKRGFRKILKKLDKKTGTNRQESYLNARIYPLEFCNEADVVRCLNATNDCLTRLNDQMVQEDTVRDTNSVPIPESANSPAGMVSSGGSSSVSSHISMSHSNSSQNSLPPPSSGFVATGTNVVGSLGSSIKSSNNDRKVSVYRDAIATDDPQALEKILIREHRSPVLTPLKTLLSLLNKSTLAMSCKCMDYLLQIIPVLSDPADISGRNFLHHHVIALGKQYVKGLEQQSRASISVPAQSPAEFGYRLLNTFGPDGINSNDSSQGLLYLFEHLPAHLKFAILQKDNYKRTPLHYAAQYGLRDVAAIIIEYLKKWQLQDETASFDDVKRWGDYEGLTPFHLAVLGTHPRTTKVLLSGMDKNVALKSPELIHIATRLDSPELLNILLDAKGIDINYAEPETHETPLYIASKMGILQTVKFLLDRNADMEIGEVTFGWTPIFVAAAEGFKEIVQTLIEHGAEFTKNDDSGWSPREHAALRGHMDIVPVLTPEDFDPFSVLDTASPSPGPSPQLSPYNMKELVTSIDKLTENPHKDDTTANHDVVVRQLKSKRQPSPAKQVKSYGHSFLKSGESLVLITLGTSDVRDEEPALELNRVPLSKLHSTELDSALSLVIHTADPNQPEMVLDLPLDNTHGSATDTITFKCNGSDPLNTVVYFDIMPTYRYDEDRDIHQKKGKGPSKLLGRAVAILRNVYTSVGEKKKSLVNVTKVPILESSTLEVLGTLKFELMLVTSFQHGNMTFDRGVYWKQMVTPTVIGHRGYGMNSRDRKSLQLGENTMDSFIAAASLGASYVEFDVQLTKDNVPVVYHDFLVAESGIDIPMHELTLEQFLGLGQPKKSVQMTRDDSGLRRSFSTTFASAAAIEGQKDVSDPSIERMKLTKTWKMKQYKGNSRGNTIASPFVTLKELFDKVPKNVGFNIEVKYPMLNESQEEGMGQVGPDMNHFVDTILKVVFNNRGSRDVLFSSFHPDICVMLSLKQPSIPIMFLTDSGCGAIADVRASSLQNGIRFARKWDILGIVSNATPIVECPRLASVVKASGLVCFTYGSENNDPTVAKLEMAAGVDAVIVDSVVAVRKELTNETIKKRLDNRPVSFSTS